MTVIVNNNGMIHDIGDNDDMEKKYCGCSF